MAAVDRPWNTLSVHFIDRLVTHLKRTRRWSRDARSLRGLNRHWCAVLSRHVVEVKPHESRELDIEDIRSLSKFQNLRVLDARPFEGSGDEAEERCRILAQTLSQLPALTEIHVQRLLEVLDHDSQLLKSIHTMYFDGNASTKQQLSNIMASNIQKLVGGFKTKDIIKCLRSVGTLKTLDLQVFSNDDFTRHFKEFMKAAKQLEELTLTMRWDAVRQNDMSKLRSLVDLRICGMDIKQNMEPLLELPKLTSLVLTLWHDELLEDPATKILMDRVESLEVCCTRHYPLKVHIDSMSVKQLKLWNYILDKSVLEDLGRRPSLKLSLSHCQFDQDVIDTRELPAMKDFVFIEDEGIQLPKGLLSAMKHLELLELHLFDTPADMELLTEINSLKNLKSLTISTTPGREKCRPALKGLEKLGELPDLSSLKLACLNHRRVVIAFINMDVCSKLEELTIYTAAWIDIAYTASTLRKRAPHLKLKISRG